MRNKMSPLRYPGGKAKLFEYTKSLIEKNSIEGCTYYEPFAGGCGLALHLLEAGLVQRLVLNDIDIHIFELWNSILYRSEELIEKIKSISINMDQWYIQKNIQQHPENYSSIDIAYSTLFLNRTNHSGILSAGPIGGYEQKGNYKIDCRFNREELVKKIQLISSFRNYISFSNLDALDFLQNINFTLEASTNFIFLDPPYYNKGPLLYLNFYTPEDHQNLHDLLLEIDSHWVVTYDNVDEVKEIYRESSFVEYEIRYELQEKKKGKEIMFFSNTLIH